MSLVFSKPPDSICVLRMSAIGDVCHTLPVIRAIQRHWPQTKITWIIGKLETELIGDIDDFEFIVFNKSSGWPELRKLRRTLKHRRFDLLLNMQASMRANLVSLNIRAKNKLGFDRARARDYQWLFCNSQIAAKENQHVLDGLVGFAQALGVEVNSLVWDIPVPPSAEAFARSILPGTQSTLIVSPCSSNRYRNWRNWSVEGYAEVINYALDNLNMRCVLTGGPSETEIEYGKRVTALTGGRAQNLIGNTSLKELFALIQRSTILVSPDSGPAHMATSAGTAVLGLYVTSNPLRTGPYLNLDQVVNKYPQAISAEFGADANNVRWGQRVRNPQAMDMIKPSEVSRQLEKMLGDTVKD